MMKLLIAYDGSEPADAAIQDLARAGLPRDLEATVLSVADLLTEVPHPSQAPDTPKVKKLPPVVVQAAREYAAQAVSEAKQAAQKGAELVRSLWPSWNVKYETLVDSPAWAIV